MNAEVGYASLVGLGLVTGYAVKAAEERRLQTLAPERRRWVAAGAIVGAIVGAKLGLLLFMPFELWRASLADLVLFEWGGRTVLGGLLGGFIGVELIKKALGITVATGDPYAVALPIGQAIGRIGCFVGGCCYGVALAEGNPWHLTRQPVQLYEAALDALLAVILFSIRKRPRPVGVLFRYYLLSYALIRFGLDFLRGDEKQMGGFLSYVQWFCLAVAVAVSLDIRNRWART